MQILQVFSTIVFLALLYKAGSTLIKVRDKDLGYEEIILVSIIILSLINTSIGVMRLCQLTWLNSMFFYHLDFSSTLFQALISYSTIKYIGITHGLREDMNRGA